MTTPENKNPTMITSESGSNSNEYAELIKHFSTLLAENKNTSKVKEPSTYDGTRDALIIDGWIRSVERYITFYNWTPEKSYLFATTLFRERADAWFRTIELTDDAPTTWLELKRLLIEFFRPQNAARIARDKFAALKQTSDLVTYVNDFMDIKLAIPSMTDEEAYDKFIRGLISRPMRAHIRQYEADSLKEAIHAALAYDSAQREEDFYARPPTATRRVIDDPMDLDAIDQRRSNNNRQFNNYPRPNNFNNYSRTSNNSYRTGNNSYYRNNNNGSYRGNSNNSSDFYTCHYCKKPGHIKRNCRTRIADIKKLDDQHIKQDFQ